MQLLNLLQSGQPLRVQDMAAALGVTRRTVFRDLRALQQTGVPFKFDRHQQRYLMDGDYFMPPVSFSYRECFGLMVCLRKLAHEQVWPDHEAVLTASDKLKRALPQELQAHCGRLLDFVAFKQDPQGVMSQIADHFYVLQNARHQRLKIKIWYDSPSRTCDAVAVVHPYAIVFIKRAWYLIAYSEKTNRVQTYKIERIDKCRVLWEAFEADPAFDVQAHFGNAWSMIPGGRQYHVMVRFAPKVGVSVDEVIWHKTQSTYWDEEGYLVFEADVDGIGEISWWILGYGDQAEVLQPTELRDLIRSRAQNMYRLYGPG